MTAKTAAQLNAEFLANLPDNIVGQITPAILRGVLSDVVNSIMPTAPVVSGNLAAFDGTTGLLKDSGGGALAVSFTPTGGISSTNVQNALAELDAEKASIASLAALAFSGASPDLVTSLVAWTPVLTFATPGDLAVTYSTQFGRYAKLSANLALVQFALVTSAFTWTTASGLLQISGLPLTSQNTAGLVPRGGLSFGGINKAGYSMIAPGMSVNTSAFVFNASGMGVAAATVQAADVPSGGTVNLACEAIIFI